MPQTMLMVCFRGEMIALFNEQSEAYGFAGQIMEEWGDGDVTVSAVELSFSDNKPIILWDSEVGADGEMTFPEK